ncbi:NAD-dependent epimerase/dehydratase family protein [Nonomuraea mesophila]|uniref:NAD-dependent epimerase/dehydratase family protein n=1 Tax=Nonomuraea mesophila TaxID=2530382 RepID=UPI00140A7183|nr:NAD-dependent epimerase/dehydratase family protein [Nonomuraea mesophila]
MDEVVITGGLGFIGSHVADAYLSAGYRVRVIDSAIGAVIDGSDYASNACYKLVREPVEDYLAGGGTFNGVDRVIHAASHVGPAGILPRAGTLGYDIVASSSAVVEECLAADVPLCVFSSAEVYGRSGILDERDPLRVPTAYNARIEYGVAKAVVEAMTVNSMARGLRAVVIRPFNVAGQRQSRAGGFVMPTFVQQALAGRPLTVFGDGKQIRAFTAADDLTHFVLDYMDAAIDVGEPIVNIGNPANRTTIGGLAERVRDLLGSDSPILHTDGRRLHGDAYAEAESFEKMPALHAATTLGWKPSVGLDDLIRATADYYGSREDVRGRHAPL